MNDKDGPTIKRQQANPTKLGDDPEGHPRPPDPRQVRQPAKPNAKDPKEHLQILLNAWLGAQSIAQQREILATTPELLSEEAEALLRALLYRANVEQDNTLGQLFEERIKHLVSCRSTSIAATYDNLEDEHAVNGGLPEGIQRMLGELNLTGGGLGVTRRIDLCQEALKHITIERDPGPRSRLVRAANTNTF